MRLVKTKISLNQLQKIAKQRFGDLVKAVVDLKKEIIAIDAEMHADEEALLLQNGSNQEDLWGINLYPEKKGKDFVEFDSIINLRPSQNNKSRGVDDPKIRKKIVSIVDKLVFKK